MITYPISKEEGVELSLTLANELIDKKDWSYLKSILTDHSICHLLIWDYVKSPKADPQILRNIAKSTNQDCVLSCIAKNEVTTVETLTDICSNPEKEPGWWDALDNPKATREHAIMMVDLRYGEAYSSGALAVAHSRFLDEEMADMLFNKYSLEDFDFSVLEKKPKKDYESLVKEYHFKKEVISAMLRNELVPRKWFDIYHSVNERQKKYDPGNAFSYSLNANKAHKIVLA